VLPRRYIDEWKEYAPWTEDAQVEQDLIILIKLNLYFLVLLLATHLAFLLSLTAGKLLAKIL